MAKFAIQNRMTKEYYTRANQVFTGDRNNEENLHYFLRSLNVYNRNDMDYLEGCQYPFRVSFEKPLWEVVPYEPS